MLELEDKRFSDVAMNAYYEAQFDEGFQEGVFEGVLHSLRQTMRFLGKEESIKKLLTALFGKEQCPDFLDFLKRYPNISNKALIRKIFSESEYCYFSFK